MKKLSEQKKRFMDNLLNGMGKQEAYEKAGYKARGRAAASCATKVLKIAEFAAIYKQRREEIREKASEKAQITTERLMEEEARLAYSDIGELYGGKSFIPPNELPEDVRRAVAGVKITTRTFTPKGKKKPVTETTYEYKFWDKGKALDRLHKIKGDYEQDNAQKADKIVINPDHKVKKGKK